MTASCPCCRAAVSVPTLTDLVASLGLSGHPAAVLKRVWRARGFPVMPDKLFDEMYADDPDGGPAPTRCYSEMKAAVEELNRALSGSGVYVERMGFKRGYRLRFDLGAIP